MSAYFLSNTAVHFLLGKKKISEFKYTRMNNLISWLSFFALALQQKFLNVLCDLQEEKQTDQTYHNAPYWRSASVSIIQSGFTGFMDFYYKCSILKLKSGKLFHGSNTLSCA